MTVIRRDDLPDDCGFIDADGTLLSRASELAVAAERLSGERDALRDQLRGAVKDHDDLRETIQNILDAGYHYAEEYRWSLQEALDPPAPEGGQS